VDKNETHGNTTDRTECTLEQGVAGTADMPPTPITALVLAGPERKRILRELLNIQEPWTLSQRNLYHDMICREWEYLNEDEWDGEVIEALEQRAFGNLIRNGVSVDYARHAATAAVAENLRNWQESPGRKERTRRRTFREAVTAADGQLAVTTGLVRSCITCGGPFVHPKRITRAGRWRNLRDDIAYCSNACRQKAYRRRFTRRTDDK